MKYHQFETLGQDGYFYRKQGVLDLCSAIDHFQICWHVPLQWRDINGKLTFLWSLII